MEATKENKLNIYVFTAGVFRSKYRTVDDLWCERDGFPVCRATMSKRRFKQIKSVMRFDDPLRRDKSDPLSPVRHMFSTFCNNLRVFVTPGICLTIDEQLLEYHGRVRFLQFIGSKPGKFGIKIFWVADANTFIAYNGLIYIGKNSLPVYFREKYTSVSHATTMCLMEPFLDSGRHLTADNWFTSLDLVRELSQRKTSFIGTVRSNNRSIPAAAKSTKGRVRKDTKYFFTEDNVLLCSYWDKGNKPVLLLDSYQEKMAQPRSGEKPETVLEYNRTKSGVDILDKKVRTPSCKRKCRRWPMAIFSNIIDVSTSNGSHVYGATHDGNSSTAHMDFLKNAGYQMVDELIRRRIEKGKLQKGTREAMEKLGYEVNNQMKHPAVDENNALQLSSRQRCHLCPREIDRKTTSACPRCRKPRCQDHRSQLCSDCV